MIEKLMFGRLLPIMTVIPGSRFKEAQLLYYVMDGDEIESLIYKVQDSCLMYDVEFGFVRPVTSLVKLVQQRFAKRIQSVKAENKDLRLATAICDRACSLDGDELIKFLIAKGVPNPKYKKTLFYGGGSSFSLMGITVGLRDVADLDLTWNEAIYVDDIKHLIRDFTPRDLFRIESGQSDTSSDVVRISDLAKNAVMELDSFESNWSEFKAWDDSATPPSDDHIHYLRDTLERDTFECVSREAHKARDDRSLER